MNAERIKTFVLGRRRFIDAACRCPPALARTRRRQPPAARFDRCYQSDRLCRRRNRASAARFSGRRLCCPGHGRSRFKAGHQALALVLVEPACLWPRAQGAVSAGPRRRLALQRRADDLHRGPPLSEGAYDPLPMRIDLVPGNAEVELPPLDEPPEHQGPDAQQQPPSRAAAAARRSSTAKQPSTSIAGLVRTVETAARGNRNKALFWACRRLVERGRDTQAAARQLEAVALDIGLPLIEVRRTIESGLRGAA